MYLPGEIDPQGTPKYLVIRRIRATGAREIEWIVDDPQQAQALADPQFGYVLKIENVERGQ
jgi:hypothetical protein